VLACELKSLSRLKYVKLKTTMVNTRKHTPAPMPSAVINLSALQA
jgi:hypothetical protein